MRTLPPLRWRKLIFTVADEAMDPFTEYTVAALDRFAGRHGWEVNICPPVDDDRPASWSRVTYLRRWLHDFDLLFYLDADALLLDTAPDPTDLFQRSTAFQALAAEDLSVCTGVWLVRGGDPRAASFLAAVDAQRDLYDDRIHEQAAVRRLLGYSDRQPGLLVLEHLLGTAILDPAWNDWQLGNPAAVVKHFSGYGRTREQRIEAIHEHA